MRREGPTALPSTVPWEAGLQDAEPWTAQVTSALPAVPTAIGSPQRPRRRPDVARARRFAAVWFGLCLASLLLWWGIRTLNTRGEIDRDSGAMLAAVGLVGAIISAGGVITWWWRSGAAGRGVRRVRRNPIGSSAGALERRRSRALARMHTPSLGTGADTRLRSTSSRLTGPALILGAAVFAALGPWAIAMKNEPNPTIPTARPALLWYGVVAVVAIWLAIRSADLSVRLSPEGILVRGLLRTRRIAWTDVSRLTMRCGETYSRSSTSPFVYPVFQLSDGDEIQLVAQGVGKGFGSVAVNPMARFFENVRALDGSAGFRGFERSPAWRAWCAWIGDGSQAPVPAEEPPDAGRRDAAAATRSPDEPMVGELKDLVEAGAAHPASLGDEMEERPRERANPACGNCSTTVALGEVRCHACGRKVTSIWDDSGGWAQVIFFFGIVAWPLVWMPLYLILGIGRLLDPAFLAGHASFALFSGGVFVFPLVALGVWFALFWIAEKVLPDGRIQTAVTLLGMLAFLSLAPAALFFLW